MKNPPPTIGDDLTDRLYKVVATTRPNALSLPRRDPPEPSTLGQINASGRTPTDTAFKSRLNPNMHFTDISSSKSVIENDPGPASCGSDKNVEHEPKFDTSRQESDVASSRVDGCLESNAKSMAAPGSVGAKSFKHMLGLADMKRLSQQRPRGRGYTKTV